MLKVSILASCHRTVCADSLLDNLDKTKITGDKNVDAIQDGVNKGVTGQFQKGGALEGVGNLASKEVFTRSERGGKNDKGSFGL